MKSTLKTNDADELSLPSIELVQHWLKRAKAQQSRGDAREIKKLSRLITDAPSVRFTMEFCDRVARPEVDAVAASQLSRLARANELPEFLGLLDRSLFRLGGLLAPIMAWLVIPLARVRMRQMVGNLVLDSQPKHLRHAIQHSSHKLNINLLGESVLGDKEASRRLDLNNKLLATPDVTYLSIKVSAICAHLNLWAYDDTVARVASSLREVYRTVNHNGTSFVNLDMEEYRDLRLTVDAFKLVLDEHEFVELDAGIVLQAYLPDSFTVLQELVGWSNARRERGGGETKIRIVKGANLAMESVEAKIHGWPQAPYLSKLDTDANYKRLLDWIMQPELMTGTRIGVASHNLFEVAWALLLSRSRNVADRIDFEMLRGMGTNQAEQVASAVGEIRLYTPIVANEDFDTAVGYLFRRLEENSSEGNFLRDLNQLEPNSTEFNKHRNIFEASLGRRWKVEASTHRTQNRNVSALQGSPLDTFFNEPDTDPAAPSNQEWIKDLTRTIPHALPHKLNQAVEIERVVHRSVDAKIWRDYAPSERKKILLGVAHMMSLHRADAIATMQSEANKIASEADVEVSEAIDFARYYAHGCTEIEDLSGVSFAPLGLVVVAPPWNFPFAIAAGGVLAALAAGNNVILKPAPNVTRCSALIAQCCWDAGIPKDALQLVFCDDGELSEQLIRHKQVDGVILTGGFETAELFHSWDPNRTLLAETSGKNALIITPNADIDLAVSDLVKSAFGHSGQKCSAASLAICVGDVYSSERFRRQLLDAVKSLRVGPASQPETTMGQLIGSASPKLLDALTNLEAGEQWLLKPELLNASQHLWSPGIKDEVVPASSFHMTECFGPVLGLMKAKDLDEAIAIQNSTPYGLTAGIHSLDTDEIEHWQEQADAGNLYVNRSLTGAIVQRQPFGGRKRSSVGPGAKAGGPNYLAQLGTFSNAGHPRELADPDLAVKDLLRVFASTLGEAEMRMLMVAAESHAYWWKTHFSLEHDPAALRCETNIFRYQPRSYLDVRVADNHQIFDLALTHIAAATASVELRLSSVSPLPQFDPINKASVECKDSFNARIRRDPKIDRVRCLGAVSASVRLDCYLDKGPAILNGRIELQRYLQEQSISRTRHRFGNLTAAL